MKKFAAWIVSLVMLGSLAACNAPASASPSSPASSTPPASSAEPSQQAPSEPEPATSSKARPEESAVAPAGEEESSVLIAYFAYSENMGDTSDMEVDAIASASLNADTANTEGNLQVMAQVIQEQTGGDVFHILMTNPYDPDYSTMLPVAIDQTQNEKWPELQQKVESLDGYDVVYLGTPVWNAVLPPAMMTFFEENDLSGKTIIPFGIHLGSRFGRIIEQIKELAPGAQVQDGFTISASTANDEVKKQFGEWLAANRPQ